MTVKEKAEELINKYHKDYDLLFWDLSWIQAKQCALIAVNEMLNDHLSNTTDDYGKRRYYFWQQVKQEIEKL
jgi:hypothetical protein